MAGSFSLLLAVVLLGTLGVRGDRDYIGAVYQHASVAAKPGSEPMYVWKTNLDVYEEQTKIAAQKNADIIVFPEMGITGMFLFEPGMTQRDQLLPYSSECPDPELEDWTPCDEPERYQAYPLERLSCMAKDSSIYVVADLVTHHECEGKHDCPEDGRFSRNTAVVFDRSGKLVLRYFKIHLFFESTENTPKEPSIPVFDTDFGRFGVIVCFDSVFRFPMIDLVEKTGIKNVLFPTYWADKLHPALPWQHGWASSLGVNFLASNVHTERTSGSGIFSGRSPLGVVYNKPGLLVAEMPVRGPRKTASKRCNACSQCADGNPSRKYTTPLELADDVFEQQVAIAGCQMQFAPLTSSEGEITVCDNGELCCSLSYKFRDNPDNELYVLGATSRLNVIEEAKLNPKAPLKLVHKLYFQACTLMKCPTDDRKSCGKWAESATATFDSFSISGNFTSRNLFPTIVNPGMTFPEAEEWDFCSSCQRLTSEPETKKPIIGSYILGRKYEYDQLDPRQP